MVAGLIEEQARLDVSDPDARSSLRRRRAWRLAPYVAALVWYAVFIARASGTAEGRRVFTLFDDAMISMTYARNLAAGDGLVWNVGGPRVEGISNPLWTGVMAVPHLLGVPDRFTSLVMAVLGAGLLCLCAELGRATVVRMARDVPLAAAAVPWLICFCYPLVYWTLRGMEVGLITALVLGSVLLALRLAQGPKRGDSIALGAVVAAGLSTRFDFLVFVPVIAAFLAARAATCVRRQALIGIAVGTLGTLGVQELARYAYYGAWVPNTYWLKVANAALGDRLDRGFRSIAFTLLASAAAAAALAVVALWKRRTFALWLPVLCATAVGAYGVYVGGDAWEGMRHANRYLTPALVLLLCVSAPGAWDLASSMATATVRRAVLLSLTAAAVIMAAGLVPSGDTLFKLPLMPELPGQRVALVPLLVLLVAARPASRLTASAGRLATLILVGLGVAVNLSPCARWLRYGAVGSEDDLLSARVGREIASFTAAHARIAVTSAGGTVYFARRSGVDLLGRSDGRIARGPVRPEVGFFPGHMKWDYAISIGDDRPDVIVQLFQPSCAELRLIAGLGYVAAVPFLARGQSALTRPFLIRSDSIQVMRERLLMSTPQLTARQLLKRC